MGWWLVIMIACAVGTSLACDAPDGAPIRLSCAEGKHLQRGVHRGGEIANTPPADGNQHGGVYRICSFV